MPRYTQSARDWPSRSGNYPDPAKPHRCELDPWQTNQSDRDYIPNPHDRWCRVCLNPPMHPLHS